MISRNLLICSDVLRPFRRPAYQFGRLKNTFLVFFFQLYFYRKYVEVASNGFIMHPIISKWLRTQKCRQKCKTIRQRGRSGWRNRQRKRFHSFNYVIHHASIRFFFHVKSQFHNQKITIKKFLSQFCVILSVLIAGTFKLKSLRNSYNLIAIQIFHLNIFF